MLHFILVLFSTVSQAVPVTLAERYPIAYKRYWEVKTVYVPIEDAPQPFFLTMVSDLRLPPWIQLIFSKMTYNLEDAKKAQRLAVLQTVELFADLRIDPYAPPALPEGPDARLYIEPTCKRHRDYADYLQFMGRSQSDPQLDSPVTQMLPDTPSPGATSD